MVDDDRLRAQILKSKRKSSTAPVPSKPDPKFAGQEALETVPPVISDAMRTISGASAVTTGSDSLVDKLYSVGEFNQNFVSQKQDLKRLEVVIDKVNDTQKTFERLVWTEKRPVVTYIRRVVGSELPDIHALYSTQLHNVQTLNSILLSMIESTGPVIGKMVRDVDALLERVAYNRETVLSINTKMPQLIEEEKKKQESVRHLDRSDPSYLRHVIDSGRRTDQLTFVYKEALKGGNQDYMALMNSILLERIVRSFYFTIIDMSNTTKRYCETLERTMIVYPTIEALVKASKAQNDGLNVLADYTNEITSRFTSMVSEVVDISKRDPFQEARDTQFPMLLELHNKTRQQVFSRDKLYDLADPFRHDK